MMRSEHREVNWLVGFARTVDARLIILPQKKIDRILRPHWFNATRGWHPAPFHNMIQVGLHWPSKTVIAYPEYGYWHNLLHELGHCVATHLNPEAVTETDFLGWEYVVMQKMAAELRIPTLEGEWFDALHDYIYNGVTIGQMDNPAHMMLEAIQAAVEYGSIVDGHPVPVR